jgi:hypothetical protein
MNLDQKHCDPGDNVPIDHVKKKIASDVLLNSMGDFYWNPMITGSAFYELYRQKSSCYLVIIFSVCQEERKSQFLSYKLLIKDKFFVNKI